MNTKDTKPFILQADSHYDLGLKIGQNFSEQIQKRVNTFIHETTSGTYNFDLIQENFPDYVDELKGMAAGSGVELARLFELNCNDVLVNKGCSTVVKKEDGIFLIGHNEDTTQLDPAEDIGIFIEAQLPNNKVSGYLYFGELLGNSYGWNENGLYLFMDAIDGITPYVNSKTLPMYFIFRNILDCTSVEEALEIFKKHPVSTGFHCVIAKENEIVTLEVLHGRIIQRKVLDTDIHTNCFVEHAFKDRDTPSLNSKVRLERIDVMIKKQQTMEHILSDRDTLPNPICGTRSDASQTLASIIVDPTNRKVKQHIVFR